ncbi:MAG TPA: hypothetical protein VHW68_13650 [Actinomycetota bacterium]|jgi:hypothetical protein|nr:hypothetical protein [Actinomycetota bacterium]
MNRSNSSSVQYGVPQTGKQALRREPAGRRCAFPACETVLSTYNTSPTCWVHTTATPRHPLAPSTNPIR